VRELAQAQAKAYTTLVDSDVALTKLDQHQHQGQEEQHATLDLEQNLDLNLNLIVDGTVVPTWTRSEAQLKALCDATAACVAVTSEGMLKRGGGKVVPVKGVTLWLKANA